MPPHPLLPTPAIPRSLPKQFCLITYVETWLRITSKRRVPGCCPDDISSAFVGCILGILLARITIPCTCNNSCLTYDATITKDRRRRRITSESSGLATWRDGSIQTSFLHHLAKISKTSFFLRWHMNAIFSKIKWTHSSGTLRRQCQEAFLKSLHPFSAADLFLLATNVFFFAFSFPFNLTSRSCDNLYKEQTNRRSPETFHRLSRYFSCLSSYLVLRERWEHIRVELAGGRKVTLLHGNLPTQTSIMADPCGTIKGKKLEYGLLATDLPLISEVSPHLAASPRWQQTEGEGQTHDCVSPAVPAARTSAVQTLSAVTDCWGGSLSK